MHSGAVPSPSARDHRRMRSTDTTGVMLDSESPEWGPLLALVGEQLVETFMWMFEVELETGTRLHAYKHIWTRRYLHLDGSGRAYYYRGEHTYRRIEPARLLEAVLETWWEGLGASAEETAASWVAIDRAQRRSPPARG